MSAIRPPTQRLLSPLLLPLALVLLLAACASAPAAAPPTVIAFPTVTPGAQIVGLLPTPGGLPLDGRAPANPATAVALANQPTPTPDYTACPPLGDTAPPAAPSSAALFGQALANALDAGGAPLQIVERWGLSGQSGLLRADIDFTGEGVPEILATYFTEDGGALALLTCLAGRYTLLFDSVFDDGAPEVQIADMNTDGRAELFYSVRDCSAVESQEDECTFSADARTFDASSGRLISLLGGSITSDSPLALADPDSDRVLEIIARLTNDGDAESGPLRTGVQIYDWNGRAYVLSIVQLDPPQFRIQVVQQADAAFKSLEMRSAIALYNQALSDTTLRAWLNDEAVFLRPYILYRLLLASAFTEGPDLLTVYQTIAAEYPDPNAAPVYVRLANAFWNGLQVTNNLRSACQEVQAIMAAQTEAIGLLNRYGSRSLVYSAQDLCPF